MTGSVDDPAAPARPAVRPTQIPIEPKVTDSATDAEELTERVAQVAKGGPEPRYSVSTTGWSPMSA